MKQAHNSRNAENIAGSFNNMEDNQDMTILSISLSPLKIERTQNPNNASFTSSKQKGTNNSGLDSHGP